MCITQVHVVPPWRVSAGTGRKEKKLKKRNRRSIGKGEKKEILGTLTTDATGKLHVAGHDGHTLGVDGTQIRIFKETNKISLSSFLKSKNCRCLEPQIRLEFYY